MDKKQCEGHRRCGGAFSFGPVVWTQCENDAIVMLTVEQNEKRPETMPACMVCWLEAVSTDGIKIVKVDPVM